MRSAAHWASLNTALNMNICGLSTKIRMDFHQADSCVASPDQNRKCRIHTTAHVRLVQRINGIVGLILLELHLILSYK